MVRICPHCGKDTRIEKKPKRICLNCNSPIFKNHKFEFIKHGLIHRDCSNPTEYSSKVYTFTGPIVLDINSIGRRKKD